MNILLPVYKPIGLTPLQVIEHVRKEYPQYAKEKIGYAGRLDPLAHGVMLLMIGDATKNREQYLSLSKSYTFEVLFGVTTDTYDTLGELRKSPYISPDSNVNLLVNSFVNSQIGKHRQSYPPYSSKTVHGKPLFWWAKEKRLDEITIPVKDIEIFSFTLQSMQQIQKDVLHDRIMRNIERVKGDFRQKDIQEKWELFFTNTKQLSFLTATFEISCSSGTYVRSICHTLGKELGCGAIALDILRTQIGEYTNDSIDQTKDA